MSNPPPRQRPPIRRVSTEPEPEPGPVPERRPRTPVYQPPPRRDPFPYIIGGILGVVLVGLALMAFLIGSITSQPGTSALPPAGNPPGQSSQLPTQPNQATSSNSSSQPTQTANAPASGSALPGTAFPSEGQTHVDEGQPITYTNYPPSSGTHYGSTATCGFSDTEVAEGKLVHSLEHGAIVLYYKPALPANTIQQLRDLYSKMPPAKYGKVKLVITPYSKLQTPMAMASWGRVQTFAQVNYDQMHAFYTALVDKGPEDVP